MGGHVLGPLLALEPMLNLPSLFGSGHPAPVLDHVLLPLQTRPSSFLDLRVHVHAAELHPLLNQWSSSQGVVLALVHPIDHALPSHKLLFILDVTPVLVLVLPIDEAKGSRLLYVGPIPVPDLVHLFHQLRHQSSFSLGEGLDLDLPIVLKLRSRWLSIQDGDAHPPLGVPVITVHLGLLFYSPTEKGLDPGLVLHLSKSWSYPRTTDIALVPLIVPQLRLSVVIETLVQGHTLVTVPP